MATDVHHVIFDLSEVLIAGILGLEEPLGRLLGVPPTEIQAGTLGGEPMVALFEGRIDEDTYLAQLIAIHNWQVDPADLKAIIRANFHRKVDGMESILRRLTGGIDLTLLSDHAREWVEYIRTIHPFLDLFNRMIFSFDGGSLKTNPRTFERALAVIDAPADACLFVDDNPWNVAVAPSVGISGILFEDAVQLESELQARGLL